MKQTPVKDMDSRQCLDELRQIADNNSTSQLSSQVKSWIASVSLRDVTNALMGISFDVLQGKLTPQAGNRATSLLNRMMKLAQV